MNASIRLIKTFCLTSMDFLHQMKFLAVQSVFDMDVQIFLHRIQMQVGEQEEGMIMRHAMNPLVQIDVRGMPMVKDALSRGVMEGNSAAEKRDAHIYSREPNDNGKLKRDKGKEQARSLYECTA